MLMCCPSICWAVPPTDDPDTLTPVIVTPNRLARTPLETGRSLNIISATRLQELQARTVPEALDYETGIHVQQTNRGAGAPIIRGFVGPQNLLLVDGVRLTSSTHRTGPNQYLALIDPNALSRIEIVRGASSVLYGNGAIGGVINMLTDVPIEADDNFEYQGRVRGRFASADLSAGSTLMFTGAYDDFGFLLGGTFDHFGTLRVGDGSSWPLSDYDAGYWRAKLLYAPDRWSVSLGYFGMLMRNAGRTDGLGMGETRLYDNDDHLLYTRFEWGNGIVDHIRITASYQRLVEDVSRFNCTLNGTTVRDRAACAARSLNTVTKKRANEDITDTVGADLEVGLSVWEKRVSLRTGLDTYYDMVQSNRQDARAPNFDWTTNTRGNFSDGSTYITLGIYAHAEALVMDITSKDVQLRLLGGIRYSYFSAFAPDVAGLGDVAYDFNGIVGSAGLELLLPDTLTMYATYVQGFRAPNLQETTVLGDTGSTFEVPNPELEPERTDTIEAGFKLELGPLQMRAAYFYTMLSDAIGSEATSWQGQDTIDNKRVAHRVNNERGESHGVEWDMALRFGRWLVAGGVAWITNTYTGSNGTTVNGRRVPPLSGNARVRYTAPESKWYFEFGTRFANPQTTLSPGDQKDARICEESRHSGTLQTPCDGTKRFLVADLRGGYRFSTSVRTDLAVTNVFDSLYRRHGSGFDAPGLNVQLSVTAEF